MQRNPGALARSPNLLPLILDWRTETLPRRPVQAVGRSGSLAFGMEPPPHWPSGPEDEPFDFSNGMRELVTAIASDCDEWRHIDASRILFTFTQARPGRTNAIPSG